MRRGFVGLVLVCGLGTGALAEPTELAGGVFIAHHPAGMEYSSTPPEGGWCAAYLAEHAIDACEEQVNRINTTQAAIWFVLAAWDEPKAWCGVEFGLGEYATDDYAIISHGPCFPSEGLEIPTANWPGPNEGTSLAITDSCWTGNFLPIYYFAGYAYAPQLVPLDNNPRTAFAGTVNCQQLPEARAVSASGAMGMLTEGLAVCPGQVMGLGEGQVLAWSDYGVGVCCSGERCAVMAVEDCSALGSEWEFHPEWRTCNPNPCVTVHRGECEFPCEIVLGAGRSVKYVTNGYERIYSPGESFVVDWRDGRVTIDGYPYLPPDEAPPPTYEVEYLRATYGSVPYVQSIVGSSADPVLWNRAVRLWEGAFNRLRHSAANAFRRRAFAGATPEAAAGAAVAVLEASGLVVSARSWSAGREGQAFEVQWRGLEHPVGMLLEYEHPWLEGNRDFRSHYVACVIDLPFFRSLERNMLGSSCVTIGYGNLQFGGSCAGEE